MIKTVIRSSNNMVIVLDEAGEQILEYQDYYPEVREKILEAAPSSAIFGHLLDYTTDLEIVPRDEW